MVVPSTNFGDVFQSLRQDLWQSKGLPIERLIFAAPIQRNLRLKAISCGDIALASRVTSHPGMVVDILFTGIVVHVDWKAS